MTSLDFPAIVDSFQAASEKLLAAMLDQSADCIKVIGPDGTLDFMNRNGRCAMGSTISRRSPARIGGICGPRKRSR